MRKIAFLGMLALSVTAMADTIAVKQARLAGPIVIPQKINDLQADSLRVSQVLDLKISPAKSQFTQVDLTEQLPVSADGVAVNVLSFALENRDYATAKLDVEGLGDNYQVLVDGAIASGELTLRPSTHPVLVKYATMPGDTIDCRINLITDSAAVVSIVNDQKRLVCYNDFIYGKRGGRTSISPSGAYALVSYSDMGDDDKAAYYSMLYDVNTGACLGRIDGTQWMPNQDLLLYERKNHGNGRHLVTVDPVSGAESILAEQLPEGSWTLSPNCEYIIFTLQKDGDSEDERTYQIREPEDRQPGWRNRYYPAMFKLDGSNALIPLTTDDRSVYLSDISRDGSKILLMGSRSRLEKRPTTVSSLYLLDANTLAVDTLLKDEGFIISASFSPDAKQLLVTGFPEAFDRIGCQLPADKYPNMTEQELYVYDLATKKAKPITKDFDPNVQTAVWSWADGQIYVMAEDRDYLNFFKINPSNGKAKKIDIQEEVMLGFTLADTKPMAAYWGQGISNPTRIYLLDLKTGKSRLLDDPAAARYQDVKVAKTEDWNFVNSKGDKIYGRFYLPDNFDPAKKYPMITYYYGGCSPTPRYFEMHYAWHVWAQQGYVVYVIQPSGATGFGQEFASRHVNTAGQGVADDIIEGVKKFVAAHPYVNSDKIGCIGASYGGFMTQYLQTVTDIFACAISHAGISDHTSYWGEGYWGYSYSEVSMAGSYPWSDTDLFVKQSPLYNADKVNTPILFLHGDADNNVPFGESIQMFTALKLLGKETAFVAVPKQDHHILDIPKRKRWHDTILAWFEKHLKDNPSWWNSMYK